MRRKIVAGNWKMNMNKAEAHALFSELNRVNLPKNVEAVIFPPSIYLSEFSDQIQKDLHIGSQNVYSENNGAFTGETSAEMLQSIGLKYCLVGHSERRAYFNETNAFLAKKVNSLLQNSVVPVYCVGEKLEEREANEHFSVVKNQLEQAIFHLSITDFPRLVIAYEPVWAIGTGQTATSSQVQEMHAFIRDEISSKYGKNVGENIRILYGGSCKPSNAKELFSCADVDGGLIGGASLKSADFIELISIASKLL